jgi:hypothetical protein
MVIRLPGVTLGFSRSRGASGRGSVGFCIYEFRFFSEIGGRFVFPLERMKTYQPTLAFYSIVMVVNSACFCLAAVADCQLYVDFHSRAIVRNSGIRSRQTGPVWSLGFRFLLCMMLSIEECSAVRNVLL